MILVTGGTGLVGTHLLFQLAHENEKIRALKRTSSSLAQIRKIFSYYTSEPEKFLSKIEWVTGDILEMDTLLSALEGVDKVFQTAALVSFDPKDKNKLLETNIQGTANVVNACLEKKIKKLVYVSSTAALGHTRVNGITTEKSEWKNGQYVSAYSLSKYEAEREAWRGMAEGLKSVIVNPSVILGPGDFNKGSSKMFQKVYDGLKVYTGGINGYVDVRDVARALILLMGSDISGERFILNSENVSYQKLFELMASSLNVEAPKYKAGKIMSGLTWRGAKIASMMTGKNPLITKQTSHTANNIYRYSNEKFVKATQMQFMPIAQSIKDTATIFLKEQQNH